MSAFVPGYLLSLSLIVAIGAQNAYVLRQGLRREHVLAIVLTCALSDAALILAGVSGFAGASAALPWLTDAARFGGAVFLTVYGARSLRAALRSTDTLTAAEAAPRGLAPTLLTCLALTWLNPHVYLDTVVLLGSISTQFAPHKTSFALGAMAASATFFTALGYGAGLLRPLFARPGAWRALEAGIAVVMWTIALRLFIASPAVT